MKAVIVNDNSTIKIEDIENPELGSNDILVKMAACGICGSDVEKVFGKYGQPSMKLGHEPAGVILKIGNSVNDFKIGDRVFTHHHVPCYLKLVMNVVMEMKLCVQNIINLILIHVV